MSIDMFYNYMMFSNYHYFVLISSSGSKNQYAFENIEDAEQLYNALSKMLKKKDVKPSAGKKIPKAD